MNSDDVKRTVAQAVCVTHQMVTLSKARIVAETTASSQTSDELIEAILREHGCVTYRTIEILSEGDSTESLSKCALAISWREAAAEAIWGLISDGLLAPVNADISVGHNHVQISFRHGSNSSGGGFDLDLTAYPRQISRLPSARSGGHTLLSSSDLYLLHLAAPGMHADLQSATKESVACFKQSLFGGACALLGKVSEGAWIELGESLLDRFPAATRSQVIRQREVLENSQTGVMQKIYAVKVLLGREEYKPLRDALGRFDGLLEQAIQWSDLVRGSRNAIHFGAIPPVPNTYESVAVLLLAAHQHLGLLYRIRAKVLS